MALCKIMKLINLKRIYHHKLRQSVYNTLLFGLLFLQHIYAVTGNLTLAYSTSGKNFSEIKVIPKMEKNKE